MTPQTTAAWISLLGIALMTTGFLFVLLRSGGPAEPYEQVQPKAYRLRKQLFIALLVGFFVLPAVTLRSMPYSASSSAPDTTVVDVTAHQWYWTLSRSEVPMGAPIVFRVASEDVNHGFGIYDEETRLIAQVQAMPGYVNQLAVRFDEPGEYRILCLEYCGIAHHGMMARFTAVSSLAALEEE